MRADEKTPMPPSCFAALMKVMKEYEKHAEHDPKSRQVFSVKKRKGKR